MTDQGSRRPSETKTGKRATSPESTTKRASARRKADSPSRSGGARSSAAFKAEQDGAYRWFKTALVPIRDVVVKWYGSHTAIHELRLAAEAHRGDTPKKGCGS